MSQTEQTESEKISYKPSLQKTTQSQYFTLNDLTTINYNESNDFSVFHMNVNSC